MLILAAILLAIVFIIGFDMWTFGLILGDGPEFLVGLLIDLGVIFLAFLILV